MIIQVSAKAYIDRDDTHSLPDVWWTIAAADTNPAVFFVQTGYSGIREFNDIAHFEVFMTQ